MENKPQFEIGKIFDPSFEGMSKSELTANLQSASKIIDGEYTKSLTQDEVGIAKSELADVSIKLAKIADEKKAVMEEFKLLEKSPKLLHKELIDTIKFKTVRKEGLLYLFADHEAGLMFSFDEDAICVDARPLSPKERQYGISDESGVRKLGS